MADLGVEGDSQRLRMVLYEPGSQFERDIYTRFQKGKPISVPDPDGIPEYKTPEYRRKRPRPGGGGSAESAGSMATRPRVSSLGTGWYLNYDTVSELLPSVNAAEPLREFYNKVSAGAADQLSKGNDGVDRITFKSGPFSLRFASQEVIRWDFVINLVQSMISMLTPQFAPMFSGEAVSEYWDLPSVQVAFSLAV